MTDFERTRAMFDLPDGVIYLDGNSLGPLPRSAADAVARVMREQWGGRLIRGWNDCGWMEQPLALGNRIGRLIGAPAGRVVVGDTLSIKIYQALAAALSLRPGRRTILSDTGNFPSDLYIAQGLIRFAGDRELRTPRPEDVEAAIDEDVAVLMLTEVDYRTGRRHDMPALTARAHAAGALVIWDLAHSAGALPVDVAGGGADFAAGCTYKYLNGGPGAPAFMYLGPAVADVAEPALAGWLGHDAPFAFDPSYRPAPGVARMRVGTPPIIAFAALAAALDVWDGVDLGEVRMRSIELSERFIAEVEARCPQLELASPRDPDRRGSQVSFRSPDGYAIVQALIDRGVIGDFRAPDIMRFGFTPLYLRESEVVRAAETLETVLRDRLFDKPVYSRKAPVT